VSAGPRLEVIEALVWQTGTKDQLLVTRILRAVEDYAQAADCPPGILDRRRVLDRAVPDRRRRRDRYVPDGSGWQRQRLWEAIAEYRHIGGDQLSARAAAERLGVAERTITRWRAELRRVAP